MFLILNQSEAHVLIKLVLIKKNVYRARDTKDLRAWFNEPSPVPSSAIKGHPSIVTGQRRQRDHRSTDNEHNGPLARRA